MDNVEIEGSVGTLGILRTTNKSVWSLAEGREVRGPEQYSEQATVISFVLCRGMLEVGVRNGEV
jgi:hypothetical protein